MCMKSVVALIAQQSTPPDLLPRGVSLVVSRLRLGLGYAARNAVVTLTGTITLRELEKGPNPFSASPPGS
jgi:hypothetical protein